MSVQIMNNTKPKLTLLWVALPVGSVALLFFIIVFGFILPDTRNFLLDQKRADLRNLVMSAHGVLASQYELVQRGMVTEEQAQQRAAQIIESMRFGKDGKNYFWINDLTPRMIMHPWRPELNGQDLTDYTDRHGVHVFQEFVGVVGETGRGFVEYEWQWNDESDYIAPKMSYVELFEPWGWIVGAGVYLSDVRREMDKRSGVLWGIGIGGVVLISFGLGLVVRQSHLADRRMWQHYETMRVVFDQSFQFMALLDTQGRVVEVNKTALEVYGLAKSEVVGGFFWETAWWEGVKDEQQRLRKYVLLAAQGRGLCWRTSHATFDGGTLCIYVSLKPARDVRGGVFGVIAEGQDVTAQMRAFEDRRRTLVQMEERNEELERVAAVIAHDLRNPVVTIKGFTGVLRQALQDGDTQNARLALGRVDQAGDRINRLLRDLGLLFRVDRQPPHYEWVSMEKLTRGIIHEYAEQNPLWRDIVLIEAPLPDVWADAERLRQVLVQLLENAFRFALPATFPRIEVGGRARNSEYAFYVRDHGKGINSAYLERIFDIFEQLVPDKRGTGMGLTLVRRIIQQHGGRVWAESDGENQGSTIWFTLPRKVGTPSTMENV